jgi:hypothetical protein
LAYRPNPKFSGEGWSECDNPSPLQRLFGLYFILMTEKSKKGNTTIETRKNKRLSMPTVKPLLSAISVQHIHFLYISFPSAFYFYQYQHNIKFYPPLFFVLSFLSSQASHRMVGCFLSLFISII